MDQVTSLEEIKRLIKRKDLEALDSVLSASRGISASDLEELIKLSDSKKIQSLIKTKYPEIIRGESTNKKEMEEKTPSVSRDDTDSSLALEEVATGESQKDRSIKMFFEAFKTSISDCSNRHAAFLAKQITTEIFGRNPSDIAKLIRSKCLNLKDKNNPVLCRRVYDGEISPSRYVDMTSEEMKSESLRNEEVKMIEVSLYECQIPTQKAETDMFKCNKCGERKCSYRQLQTRSGDEPMTTFVTCECGNKWRFC
ncbi:transcription elongation factor S-II [Encephalitozoon hellem]|uniref:Transcription elongation factor S-II n=1 Tax=Encephalitozoon hellem TaxID=27973 RepID=A0A9Q9C7M8_ENCHE|nr:transcription elongation factor S-II [Encephalitozoon hellem ATCC 50504]AFM98064.1 transcription elongation factor S-II [Encephalitozoon hellem ATCC 50504]KAG5859828.1 transcription elongation factor S-II [Encephalitozoon hellem]UTX42905.1 transcription elongation factor S-II [Encephalitozoon hellem]WEL38362.1 transcription elongation factor S-II [Encephalitozoon hellem]|eukprot:XP_003887045.1 transcription elongation factor S-II [Encephalitozoon hellem ATCC 50504]